MATCLGRSYKRQEMADKGAGLEIEGQMEPRKVTPKQTDHETGPAENVSLGQAYSEEEGTSQLMQLFITQMIQLVSKMTEQQQQTAAEERAVEHMRQKEERRQLAE